MTTFAESVRLVLDGRTLGQHGDLGTPDAAITLRPASVLVPVFEDEGDPGIVFVRRSEDLGAHAGQIAFPGGSREPGEDELTCALREAREEIGLDPADVDVLGAMDRYVTITRFLVSPFVARLKRWPVEFVAEPREVASVLTVPVARLVEPGVLRTFVRETEGGPREIDFFVAGDDVIWGATARMLRQLLELVRGEPLVPAGEVPWSKVRW